MSKAIFVAVFASWALVQSATTLGNPGDRCAGQECLHQENDEVTLLQVSKDVAQRMGSQSPQLSHEAVVMPKANTSQGAEAVAPSDGTRHSDLALLQDRPPPNIMLVLGISVLLAILTLALCYVALVVVRKRVPAEHLAEAEATVDWIGCFMGIIICFCSYGIAQEYVMTQLYGGEKFPSVPFLILCNRIVIVAVAIVLLIAKGEGIMWKPTMLVVFPGASSMASSWCQYECLHYVTFPTQVVFKSAKIVPTMIINTLVNFVWAPAGDYVQAIIITACVTGFSMLTEEASSSDGQSNTFKGIVELSIFLLGDALTSNGEKWVYTKYPTFSNTQMMFAMGVVGLIYSSVLVNFEHGGYPFMFGFLGRHPSCLIQIFALALCSMSGQYVIYYTVQKHGPVALAIMMTTRQILSIFISAALYGHVIPLSAILLAAVCFAAVLAKPLYKWYSKGGKSLKGKAES